jgi:hypothetical protein
VDPALGNKAGQKGISLMREVTKLTACALASIVLALCSTTPATAVAPAETSCTECHGSSDYFEADGVQIIKDYLQGVHAEVGLSCHDCHGGNPSLSMIDDPSAAMDESFTLNPYRGAPERGDIPSFCGSCHSAPSYMKRFKPDARIDQEEEFWTSQHGLLLEQGDVKVATCTSCHGVHGILRVDDPESPVYPLNVANTCGVCHSSSEMMAQYRLPDGRPLPVDQQSMWQQSVHAEAMFQRDDLTAPTCNDCHANHGAAPPGLDSVTFVCGQCHGREADLFRGSPKHGGFEEHNEYLTDAGSDGCAACHEPPEPQAWVTGVSKFGECTSCHGNHGIVRPTSAMFGALPAYPCAFCHENPGLLAAEVAEPETSQDNYSDVLTRLMAEAEEEGLQGEDLFNRLVDKARTLEEHSIPGELDDRGLPVARPEFDKLFDKFRIGKTYFEYQDPTTGETAQARITRCNTCHVTGAMVSEETPGAMTGIDLLERMTELTALIGRAERIALDAHRGGVEIRDAQLEIDQAVDAQIGLEVQVHAFTAAEGSEFLDTYEKGLNHARTAIDLGVEAKEEIQSRRHWLALSLIAIVAVLISLGLKIREISTTGSKVE